MTHGAAHAAYHSQDMGFGGRGSRSTYKNTNTRITKNDNIDGNYPGDAHELEKNPDWDETTHPGQASSGKREFKNKKTSEKIRNDKGEPERPGHRGRDHHHRMKPVKPGTEDYHYLDKNGNVVPKGSGPSHLYAPPKGATK